MLEKRADPNGIDWWGHASSETSGQPRQATVRVSTEERETGHWGLKKGLGAALARFDEYALVNYRRDHAALKLVDAVIGALVFLLKRELWLVQKNAG